MSHVRIKSIKIKNYRSFGGTEQIFKFPTADYNKPIALVGYNNSGKTNLMNAILYGVGEKFVSENTFEKTDLHNLDYENQISIITDLAASDYSAINRRGEPEDKSIRGEHYIYTNNDDDELKSSIKPSFFGANKHYNIFYVNFHDIKDQISTQKTSRGNLKSFLAKHIKKLVDSDLEMKEKKGSFEETIQEGTDNVLENSKLERFISTIKENYSKNLRNNNCEVFFGLPEYEDIFLQMMFKIGLNGETTNLVPVDHFGDGYISMFVMAVIQSIAESDDGDFSLFLFEEPESFLHENHQEYFYKTVLCGLAERGHQVIYTTHSDKMVDIFDTKGLIRLEVNEDNQTVNKYNNIGEFSYEFSTLDDAGDASVTLENYNEFVKTIEPNLNKILFSKKVILVEGPNDVMVYKYAIEKKIMGIIESRTDIIDKVKYAATYLNFHNISIIPHHGKATALLLIELCKHIQLDYFVINDRDFADDFVQDLASFNTETDMKAAAIYTGSTKKGMITTNRKLIYNATHEKIHFNIPKLERLIDYPSNDKDSVKIWDKLTTIATFNQAIFPESLEKFLEFDKIETTVAPEETTVAPEETTVAPEETADEEMPF